MFASAGPSPSAPSRATCHPCAAAAAASARARTASHRSRGPRPRRRRARAIRRAAPPARTPAAGGSASEPRPSGQTGEIAVRHRPARPCQPDPCRARIRNVSSRSSRVWPSAIRPIPWRLAQSAIRRWRARRASSWLTGVVAHRASIAAHDAATPSAWHARATNFASSAASGRRPWSMVTARQRNAGLLCDSPPPASAAPWNPSRPKRRRRCFRLLARDRNRTPSSPAVVSGGEGRPAYFLPRISRS